MEPLEFCRRMKALKAKRSLDWVILQEEERGVHREYSHILAKSLGLSPYTVEQDWGAGIEFPQMPIRWKRILKYVLYWHENLPVAA